MNALPFLRKPLIAEYALRVVDEIQGRQCQMPVSLLHHEGYQAEIWKNDYVLHDEEGGKSEEQSKLCKSASAPAR